MRLLFAASLLLAIALQPLRADVLDPESDAVPVLEDLAAPLGGTGVDVLYSYDSAAGGAGPSFGDAPRLAPLAGFDVWPGVSVDLDRYAEWLDAFATGARGALAAAPANGEPTRPERDIFEEIWRGAEGGERVFVTFDAADLEVAERIAGVLEAKGYAVYLAIAAPDREVLDPEALGRLFVAADHHLVIDTASARLNPVLQFEAHLLAELQRQDAWLASRDPGLPPVKRGSMDVIESLGALPMQVVPGGVVLGVRAQLDPALVPAGAGAGSGAGSGAEGTEGPAATFAFHGSDYGLQVGDRQWVLEQVSEETREAIRAFVANEDSHSVVDIAGGEVTLAAPFQDTRIGNRLTKADRLPFEHLSVRGAQKSLVVDQAVRLRLDEDGDRLAADVTLEVRFYRRDGEGHADRLATLRFTVEDATGSARLLDLTWSRRPGLRIGFDGSGTEELVDDLEQLALDAALIALARL